METTLLQLLITFVCLLKMMASYDRVVIAMTSTQLKKSRRWIAQMRALQIPVGNKKINPPMYSHIYPISSVPEQNDKGAWSGFAIGNPTMISTRVIGKRQSFLSGSAGGTDS